MRSYEAARSLFSFLGFCAWVVIIVGVLAALMGFAAVNEMSSFGRSPSGAALITSLLPGVGIAFLGFLGLALVQMGRAAVDTAEYTQQMLQIARDQLEVSRQTLNKGDQAPQTFAAKAPKDDTTKPPVASFADQKAEPKPSATGPDTISYRNKEIKISNGKFLYNGIAFDTQDKAEKYIDAFGEPALQKSN